MKRCKDKSNIRETDEKLQTCTSRSFSPTDRQISQIYSLEKLQSRDLTALWRSYYMLLLSSEKIVTHCTTALSRRENSVVK